MADIKKELNDIKTAIYGRDVRGSIHDGIDKINKESENSKQKADEAHDVMESIINDGFDNAALEANFEQKLDDKIGQLQPEWTQFQTDVTSQLNETETNVYKNMPYKIKPNYMDRIDEILSRSQFYVDYSEKYGFPRKSIVIGNMLNLLGGTDGTQSPTVYLGCLIKSTGTYNINGKININSIPRWIVGGVFRLCNVDHTKLHGVDWDSGVNYTTDSLSWSYDDSTGKFSYSLTANESMVGKVLVFRTSFNTINKNNNSTKNDEYYGFDEFIIKNSGNIVFDNRLSNWIDKITRSGYRLSGDGVYNFIDDFYIFGNSITVGKKHRIMYVLHDAENYGDGTKASPTSLRNFLKCDFDVETLVFLKGQTYDYSTSNYNAYKHQEFFNFDKKIALKNIITLDGVTTIRFQRRLLSSAFSIYDTENEIYTVNYAAESNTYFHFWQRDKMNYTKVDNISQITKRGQYFYDYNSSKLYIKFWDGVGDVFVSTAKNGIYMANANKNIFISGLIIEGAYFPHTIKNTDTFWLDRLGGIYPSGGGDCIDVDDSNGILTDCHVRGALKDGYSFHGHGHTELYDCYAQLNLDDGCSHHSRCTFYIQGGNYSQNRKGGVIPANGAKGVCVGVTTQDNKGGSDSSGDVYGGFISLDILSSNEETYMVCYGCESINDHIGFVSAGGKALLEIIGCKVNGADIGTANLRWALSGAVGNLIEYGTKFTNNKQNNLYADTSKVKIKPSIN